MIWLAGTGCGPETLTEEARRAIVGAGFAAGAPRLLKEQAPLLAPGTRQLPEISPEAILEALRNYMESAGANEGIRPDAVVLYSGDPGLYSGARKLGELLKEAGIPYRVLPGISSVQMLSAALQRPWQDWAIVSGHGRSLDLGSVMAQYRGRDIFFLTDRTMSPAAICRELVRLGLGETPVVAGECLGTSEEKLTAGTAETLQDGEYAALSVLLVEAAGRPEPGPRPATVLDREMIRGEVPMTKQEVRAAAVAHLQICPGDRVWDIGAGTGSISIAMALAAPAGKVWAVERDPEACGLIERNRRALGAWNLEVVQGSAPEALAGLPAPDAVMIGGSGGRLEEILDAVLAAAPNARICISAVLVETLARASAALAARGIAFAVTSVTAAESRTVGGRHMMRGQDPVWLIVREDG